MEGTIAEIRMFAADFAPRYWAYCSGQILSIAQNTALFSLLGTTYGGNGQTTFALPEMRGRVAIGTGSGPGLTSVNLGELKGTETNNILANNIPLHSHVISGVPKMLTNNIPANAESPNGNYFANDGSPKYKSSGSGTMKPANVSLTLGTNAANLTNNMMPYFAINYVICIQGVYPSRN